MKRLLLICWCITVIFAIGEDTLPKTIDNPNNLEDTLLDNSASITETHHETVDPKKNLNNNFNDISKRSVEPENGKDLGNEGEDFHVLQNPRNGRSFWKPRTLGGWSGAYRRHSYYPYRSYGHVHHRYGRPHYVGKRSVMPENGKDLENEEEDLPVLQTPRSGKSFWKTRTLGGWSSSYRRPSYYPYRSYGGWSSTYRRPSYYPYRSYGHVHNRYGRPHYVGKRSVEQENEKDLGNEDEDLHVLQNPRNGRSFWKTRTLSGSSGTYRRPSYYPYQRYEHVHDRYGRPHYVGKRSVEPESRKDLENEEEDLHVLPNPRNGRSFWKTRTLGGSSGTYRSYYPYQRYEHVHDRYGRPHYLGKRSPAQNEQENVNQHEMEIKGLQEKNENNDMEALDEGTVAETYSQPKNEELLDEDCHLDANGVPMEDANIMNANLDELDEYGRPSYYPYQRYEHVHDRFGRPHYLEKRSSAQNEHEIINQHETEIKGLQEQNEDKDIKALEEPRFLFRFPTAETYSQTKNEELLDEDGHLDANGVPNEDGNIKNEKLDEME